MWAIHTLPPCASTSSYRRGTGHAFFAPVGSGALSKEISSAGVPAVRRPACAARLAVIRILEYTNILMSRSAAAKLNVQPVSRLFKALGDETRLRIVALLVHGELCVCHLVAALDLTQPTTSRHLAVLRNAGVVESRRAGSWVYYRLADQADPDCERQLRTLVSAFVKRAVIGRDVARLLRVKAPQACR